jgi:transcriptional regulator with XRE-family HTH domain
MGNWMPKVKNLSQVELAEKVGVTRAHISKVMRGEAAPSLQLACKIADALDITVDDLLLRIAIKSSRKEN